MPQWIYRDEGHDYNVSCSPSHTAAFHLRAIFPFFFNDHNKLRHVKLYIKQRLISGMGKFINIGSDPVVLSYISIDFHGSSHTNKSEYANVQLDKIKIVL